MSFTSSERDAAPHPPEAGTRWSDVYLSAAARGVSIGGDLLAATALALALQSAGAGGRAVSAMLLASTLPLAVLAPLTGRLVDRVDSRALLVTAALTQTLICTVLAYTDHVALMIALVALLSCGLAVTQPTLAALLPAMAHRDDLPKAAAITQTSTSLGILAAPAAAGILLGQFGLRTPLLIDAASYLALVAAGLLIRTRRGATPARTQPATIDQDTHTPAGHPRWRLRQDPLLHAMLLATAGTLAAVGMINVVAVFLIRDTMHASTTAYGLIEAVWTAGLLAGAWLLGRLATRTRDDAALLHAILFMLAGTSSVILTSAVAPGVWSLAPLWLVGGTLNGGENVLTTVLTSRRAAPHARGHAFATLTATIQGASMIGYLAGGLLLGHVLPRPLTALAGAAGLAVTVTALAPVRRATRRERAATQPHHQPAPRSALEPSTATATTDTPPRRAS